MKFSEIAHLEQKELWIKLSQLKKELFDSRMKLKMQRLSNPLRLRFLRRDIARIQTALSLKKAKPAKKRGAPPANKQAENKPKPVISAKPVIPAQAGIQKLGRGKQLENKPESVIPAQAGIQKPRQSKQTENKPKAEIKNKGEDQ